MCLCVSTISEAKYNFKYFLSIYFCLLLFGPALESVHHVTVNEREDCNIFLVQEGVMGNRILQYHEFFSMGQSLRLEAVLDALF